MKGYHIIGEKPKYVPQGEYIGLPIPENATIWNAPRPLFGSCLMEGDKILANHGLTWQGDFHHGIFYAATFPNPHAPWERHDWLVKSNIENDAWVVTFVNQDQVDAWAKEYYSNEHREIMREMNAAEVAQLIRDDYLREHWNIEVEV